MVADKRNMRHVVPPQPTSATPEDLTGFNGIARQIGGGAAAVLGGGAGGAGGAIAGGAVGGGSGALVGKLLEMLKLIRASKGFSTGAHAGGIGGTIAGGVSGLLYGAHKARNLVLDRWPKKLDAHGLMDAADLVNNATETVMKTASPVFLEILMANGMLKSSSGIARFVTKYIAPSLKNFVANKLPFLGNSALATGAKVVNHLPEFMRPANAANWLSDTTQAAKKYHSAWEAVRKPLDRVMAKTPGYIKNPYQVGSFVGDTAKWMGGSALLSPFTMNPARWATNNVIEGVAQGTESARANIRGRAADEVSRYVDQMLADPATQRKLGLGLLFKPNDVRSKLQQMMQQYRGGGGAMQTLERDGMHRMAGGPFLM